MNGVKCIRIAALMGALVSLPAFAQADNTNSKTDPSMSGWVHNHKGNITRQEYMDEMGRRWDAMDAQKQGLSPSQVNGMYGQQPDPTKVMKGNNRTNPTGNEPKGQNSGGK